MTDTTTSYDGAHVTCPRCGRTSYNPNDVREGYCGACHDWTGRVDAQAVQMFTIYDRPSDHPRHVVLRVWRVLPGGRTVSVGEALCDTVDEARAPLQAAGFVCLGRQDDDDPVVVETWI